MFVVIVNRGVERVSNLDEEKKRKGKEKEKQEETF